MCIGGTTHENEVPVSALMRGGGGFRGGDCGGGNDVAQNSVLPAFV